MASCKAVHHVLALVLVLVLAAATTSESLIVINGMEVTQLRILGQVTCDLPPPPTPPGTRPILNGTNVALNCGGQNYSLAQAVADVNGFYELVFNTVDTVLFDPNTCFIVVRLPIVRCLVYPPTGTLRATLTLISFLQPVSNAIAVLTAGPLRLVT